MGAMVHINLLPEGRALGKKRVRRRGYQRAWSATPEGRVYNAQYSKAYKKTPKSRIIEATYRKTTLRQKALRERSASPEAVVTRRKYERSAQGLVVKRRYEKSPKGRANKRRYERERRASDVNYKLARVLRNRLWGLVRSNQKSGSAVRDLGCTVEELKQYLEVRFYPHPETGESMTWDNWSLAGWHIDHIKPLAKFDLTDRQQFLEACHYTNLQPLWAEQNRSKGAR